MTNTSMIKNGRPPFGHDRKTRRWYQEKRVEFLRANPTLMDLPPKILVGVLKKYKLVAPSTYWKDVQLDEWLKEAKR